jgi:cytochrome c biogenesis protein CcmG/thiol:disulfide interchange protein DsbE
MTRVLVVLVLGLGLAALLAYGLQPRNPRDVRSPNIDRVLPTFEGALLERYHEAYGEALRSVDYAGTPLVVNFWASWCPPCRREAPRLEAAWREYEGQVMFIGVNFQDKDEAAEAFLERFPKSYPSVRDPRGSIGIDWGVFGLPETYFIRADGTLSFKQNGEISMETLETQLQALLE